MFKLKTKIIHIFYFTLLIAGMVSITLPNAQAQAIPQTLSEFKFIRPNGQPFTKANLKAGAATVVIFFDPDCEHCQQQAQWLKTDIAKLKSTNVQFMWVSTADPKPIADFEKRFFTGITTPPIYFAQDKDYNFDNYFGYSEVPNIKVYDSKGKFVKEFKKEVAINELLPLLK